jgi:hypothetical protein
MWLLLFDWFWWCDPLPLHKPLPDSRFTLLSRFVPVEVVNRSDVPEEVLHGLVGVADSRLICLPEPLRSRWSISRHGCENTRKRDFPLTDRRGSSIKASLLAIFRHARRATVPCKTRQHFRCARFIHARAQRRELCNMGL